MSKNNLKFNSKTIHGGQQPDKAYGAVMPPIYQTSTYVQTTPGGHKGFEYSRSANPTRTALENSLASIENGNYGLAFGSGLAAIDAVIKLLNPGDEVVSTNDLYGGSYGLFKKILEKLEEELPEKYIQLMNDVSDGFIPSEEQDVKKAMKAIITFLNKSVNIPFMSERKEQRLFSIVIETLFEAMKKGNG